MGKGERISVVKKSSMKYPLEKLQYLFLNSCDENHITHFKKDDDMIHS